MSALAFANYLEKAAKTNTTLQRLLQRVAECINANEAQNEETLEYENDQLIMYSTDAELIQNQFDELVAQLNEAQAAARQCHQISWRMYELLKQISWNKIVGFDIQKMNWQYNQEMHEAKQKNAKKWLMYQRMEERNIVQQLRQEENKYKKVQAELESTQNNPKSYLQILLRKLSTLETERNIKIVSLIKSGKQIEQLKIELKKIKQSASVCKELETKKQALHQELQQMQLQRPLSATMPEMKAMEQEHLDWFSMRNFTPFNSFEVELKLPTLADYFNEWETKWQLERQRALLAEEVQAKDSLQLLRSILRRPSTESQGSITPKSYKSVRFTLPSEENVEIENVLKLPPTGIYNELLIDNTNEQQNNNTDELPEEYADEQQENEMPVECITLLSGTPTIPVPKPTLNDITVLDSDEEKEMNEVHADEQKPEAAAVEDMTVLDSDEEKAENEGLVDEDMTADEDIVANEFDVENNDNEIDVINDACSMENTYAEDKPSDKSHATNSNKLKIEILECRIIKSADNALPKAANLPVDLPHESLPIAHQSHTHNAAINTDNSNSTKDTFHKPIPKPKSRKVENSDQFFEQLLKYSCENSSSDNWELSAAFEAIDKNAKNSVSHAETNFMNILGPMNDEEPESTDEQSPMEFKNLIAENYEQDLSDLSDNGSQTINLNFL